MPSRALIASSMQNPKQAQQEAQLAIDFINNQGNAEHHKSRLAMLTTIVNKARKRLKQ